jgi:hypothetical protein
MDTKVNGYSGVVTDHGKTVVLDNLTRLPEGTRVWVTPFAPAESSHRRGSPAEVLEAMVSGPLLSHQDIQDLRRVIEDGRTDVDWASPLDPGKDE